MEKYDVHICTISGQPTPNYIPLLAKEFRPKILILLVSKEMQDRAKAFRSVLRQFCNDIKIIELPILDETNLSLLKNALLDTIVDLDIPTDKVGFNLTGGTKLMAIETHMLAQDLECGSFYFLPKKNEIFSLNTRETLTLVPQNLTVQAYLELHGFEVKNQPFKRNRMIPLETQELLTQLISLSATQRNSMTQLYALISSAKSRDLQIDISHAKMHRSLEDIIYLFEDYGYLSYKNGKLLFADEEDKKFVHGGWFEEYVFSVIRGLEGVQDCLMNIEIIYDKQRDKDHTRHEVDVAYMKDNALHVVECKSRNYDSKGNRSNNDIGNGDLFKLETLQKLGGLYTQKIFVSYFDVPDYMKRRADTSGIKLIELSRNENLKAHLSR